MSKASVHLTEGLKATIHIRQHTLIADEPVDIGGTDEGPESLELLTGTLGACIAITVRLYARRKEWPLEGVDVDVEMKRYKKEEYPAYTGEADAVNVFTEKVVFHGPLSDEQLLRLHEIAMKCPVRRILTQPNLFVESLPEAEG